MFFKKQNMDVPKPVSPDETHTSSRPSAEGDIPNSRVETPEIKQGEPPEFKPTTRLYVAFLTLAVITLMVALDGTSLSVALPVSCPARIFVGANSRADQHCNADRRTEAQRKRHRSLLVRHVVLVVLDHFPTQLRFLLSHLRSKAYDPDRSGLLLGWSHRCRGGQ